MPYSLRPIFRLAVILIAVAFVATSLTKIRGVLRPTEIDGSLLGCAAFVVAEFPAPQLLSPDQVADTCNRVGRTGPLHFRAVPGTLTPPPGAIAAAIVHQPVFDGPLAGVYPIEPGKAYELAQDGAIHIRPDRRFTPEDVGPTDQIFWLAPR